ncbi:MAG: hypothetical protein QOJ11_3135 [Frankiales bacterium]|jgi:hypothetical protein|nr:hypothetical protein [Frankiales bacterium]
MATVSKRRSRRTRTPLTDEHLARLAELARLDHLYFTRAEGRPEYADRRLLVVLAQGAAKHWVDGTNGVKDLDVWTFYARLPGERFPGDKRERYVDFGPSSLGRQASDFGAARSPSELARWQRWDSYEGRRVDLLMRALDLPPGSSPAASIAGLREWLAAGAMVNTTNKPSSWWLAQKAAVVVYPARYRGRVVWPLVAGG